MSLWSRIVSWFTKKEDTMVDRSYEPQPADILQQLPIVDNSKLIFESPFENVQRCDEHEELRYGVEMLDEEDEIIEFDPQILVPIKDPK